MRRVSRFSVFLLLAGLLPGLAAAQAYPAKPIGTGYSVSGMLEVKNLALQ
jgi:hypothetical protein